MEVCAEKGWASLMVSLTGKAKRWESTHKGNDEEFILSLVRFAADCLLYEMLDVGPRADGTIPAEIESRRGTRATVLKPHGLKRHLE